MLDDMFDSVQQNNGIDRLKDLLRNGICTVVFTKKDGTERTMRCTLLEQYIVVPEKKTDRVKKQNDDVIGVWDIDLNSWRSFRYDSLKEVHY